MAGHATLLKKPLQQSKSKGFLGGGKSFAGQKETAGMIGDGQRVAVQVGDLTNRPPIAYQLLRNHILFKSDLGLR